ncbi:hypothetical protein AB0O07_16430 [Streptomyces sp. NPDC093085]|uniref:hypothetical protein n=1 Tax=Streptomyces sp. NPDC093085 TaxID=3155068 RepID=UPI003431EC05
MSTARFYNVTVVCEGPTATGALVRVVLAARQAVTADAALVFLRQQARRIANGLDPGPGTAWTPRGTLTPVWSPDPDVPTTLRIWCHTPQAQRTARERLLAGAEFTLTANDFSGRYTLRALPVPLPAPVLAPQPTPQPAPGYLPLPLSAYPPPRHARPPDHPDRHRHRKPRWLDRLRHRLRLLFRLPSPSRLPFPFRRRARTAHAP